MESASNIETARILVVEDDEDYAKWIVVSLQALGITQITQARDGEDALAITRGGETFDLIICDWMMPNMDGLTFLKRYREMVESSMFLVLTAKSGLEDVFEATQAGATNYLVKPLQIEEFQRQVFSMLR